MALNVGKEIAQLQRLTVPEVIPSRNRNGDKAGGIY